MKNRTSSRSKKTSIRHKSRSQETFYNRYARERDEFFMKHKYSRHLIGALIIAFAINLGLSIRKTHNEYVATVLAQEGIAYPFDETPPFVLGAAIEE